MEQRKKARQFGAGLFIILCAFSMMSFWKKGIVNVYAISLMACLFLATLLLPDLLWQLRKAWIRLGDYLGKIVNPIVLAVLYFCVICPIGLVLRLIGKDLLGLRWDKTADSYWKERDVSQQTAESYRNQF